MTRKDYRLIAEEIKHVVELDNTLAAPALRMLVSRLCTKLHEDNPNFKAEVFVKACGF